MSSGRSYRQGSSGEKHSPLAPFPKFHGRSCRENNSSSTGQRPLNFDFAVGINTLKIASMVWSSQNASFNVIL